MHGANVLLSTKVPLMPPKVPLLEWSSAAHVPVQALLTAARKVLRGAHGCWHCLRSQCY